MITEKNEKVATALSVIVPVYNAEAVLPRLFDRLYPVVDGLGVAYEVVFVDDSSRDRSPTLLRQQHKLRSDTTRVLLLRGNVGMQTAIVAGLEVSQGSRVITLAADLQDPPEEIPKLLAEIERGHDYVGSIRRKHPRPKWRDLVSNARNWLLERMTRVRITDPGSMLRAYDREIVNAVLASKESGVLVPALAHLYAVDPIEILVDHDERAAQASKYTLFSVIRRNLDLMTGFSIVPLQVFSLLGIGMSLAAFLVVIYLVVKDLIVGTMVDGGGALFAILFLLSGLILFGIGLLSAYLGCICEQSRGRPRYLLRAHLRPKRDAEGGND